MKKIIILILLFFISFNLSSKIINIKVIDQEIKIPLEGVKIHVKNLNKFFYTDSTGMITITIPDNEKKIYISASIIGYQNIKKIIKKNEYNIILEMLIDGILEGNELIIEEKKLGSKKEKLGESIVLDSNDIKNTSKIGIIEDIMSTVKTLPGVSYAGRFDINMSVRGGNPSEFTSVYDGFIIRYPYMCVGTYSIFNPNIIDSIKLSTGIFNVKHGFASSALLEIDSVKPDNGLKFMTKLSTMSYEMILQTPLWSKKSGLLIGGKLFFGGLPVFMNDEMKKSGLVEQDNITVPIPPYFRNVYLKWYWKPNNRFEWFINGFFNNDGIKTLYDYSLSYDSISDDENYVYNFDYYNYYTYVFTGFNIFPVDRLLINYTAGYEYLLQGTESIVDTDKYILYKKRDLFYEQNLHSFQTKLNADITIHDKIILSTGLGLIYDYTYLNGGGIYYKKEFENISGNITSFYKKTIENLKSNDKNILKSFLYLNFYFNIIPDLFNIDLGCRLDHNYLFGNYNIWHLNTYPVISPRLNINIIPLKNLKYLNKLTLSAGIGIFNKVVLEEETIEDNMKLNDFDILIPKVLSTVLGIQFDFPLGFRFKIEGYYKYSFHRTYINSKSENNNINTIIHSDGFGHIAGFDIMLQRKISRYIDGFFSYSFVYARYFDPESDGMPRENFPDNPKGIWYYPSFHRFHTLNLVINIRPVKWFTITSKLTFASGKPAKKIGEPEYFYVELDNGLYTQNADYKELYDDNLRTDFSIPFDLKFTFNFYFKKTKLLFESYIAVQDLFVFIYSPDKDIKIKSLANDEISTEDAGLFLSIPEISFGIELSY